MKRTGNFAAVQMDSAVGDLNQNKQNIIRLLKEVKRKEPETIFMVFPEMVLYGYGELEKIKEHTQKEIDDCLDEIAKSCKEELINIVVGAPFIGTLKQEEWLKAKFTDAGETKGQLTDSRNHPEIENALYLITEYGEVQKIYSKMHLIDQEQQDMVPGNSYTLCELPFGRVGFLICWDMGFTEPARLYAKEGIDLLVVSAAWEKPYQRQWELAVCGRAFDNSIPVIASNRVGQDGTVNFAGHSMITDSLGNIRTQCLEEEGYVVALLDFDTEKDKRKQFGSQVEELREDTYNIEHLKVIKLKLHRKN